MISDFKQLRLKRWLEKSPKCLSVKDYVQALYRFGFSASEAKLEVEAVFWKGEQQELQFLHSVIRDIYVEQIKQSRVLIGKHTGEEWQEKLNQYNNRCLYCGRVGKLTKDYIVPISLGGVNTIDNIVPACMKCNRKKNKKKLVQFKEGIMLKIL